MADEIRPLTDLILDPNNARRRTERSSYMIGRSLERFGPLRSLVGYRTKDGKIMIKAGNGTLVEAGQLGFEGAQIIERNPNLLTVVVADDLNDEDWAEYGVADNRSSDTSTWDTPTLIETHLEVPLTDWFTEEEIADWGEDISPELNEDAEESAADLIEKADNGGIESRFTEGDIIQLGRHKIACGDSTDEDNIRALLGAEFGNVGMVWADAPYGISVVGKDGSLGGGTKGKYSQILGDESKDVAYAAFRICQLFSSCPQIWWGANHFGSVVTDSPCWIVWDKQDGKSVTFADCELAWTNINQPARIFKHIWDGFRRDSERGEMRVHPTQKPVALCEWAFEKYGNSSDVIFDPFLGSAPSIIAAQQMVGKRTVYGFELSPDYCEVIAQRFERLTGVNAEIVGKLPGY